MQKFRTIGGWISSGLIVLGCQSSVQSSGGPDQPAAPGAQPSMTGVAPSYPSAPPSTDPAAPGGATTYPAQPGTTSVPPASTDAASTTYPTGMPSTLPSTLPTAFPTAIPTTLPTAIPTTLPPQTPPAGAPAKVRTEGDRILLPGNVVFDTGRAILSPTPENQTILTQLKQFLLDTPKVTTLRIEGYTDNVGKPESNLELSGKRALAIKHWLVANGVAAERVVAVGFGQEKPIADNATPEARAQNRRTEFKIAAVNGRPYRGVPINGGGTEFK